jgi:hypothetical protein
MMNILAMLSNHFSYLRASLGKESIPYTPQQNGVAEWKNRAIMEMAHCMLHSKKMKLSF